MSQQKRIAYTHRNPPPTYSADWMRTEFGNVERGVNGGNSSSVSAYFFNTSGTINATPDNAFYSFSPTGAITFVLPDPRLCPGYTITALNESSVFAVTVQTIQGGNVTLSTANSTVTVRSNGLAWYKTAST